MKQRDRHDRGVASGPAESVLIYWRRGEPRIAARIKHGLRVSQSQLLRQRDDSEAIRRAGRRRRSSLPNLRDRRALVDHLSLAQEGWPLGS